MMLHPTRSLGWITGLILAGCLGQAADSVVPDPGQVFTPRSAVLLYIDGKGVRESGVGKLIAEHSGEMASQASQQIALPAALRMQSSMSNLLSGAQLAEFAASAEPEDFFKGLESGKADPKASFLAAARLVPAIDTDKLAAQLLAEIETENPGMSNKVAASRTTVGAATVYVIPADALKEARIPFEISLALGPAKDGTVITVGRTEAVKDFLHGKLSGETPARVAGLLPDKGHVWFYAPIPADATANLKSGLAANPMAAGMLDGMDKIREFGLNLNFSEALGLELSLGCTDADAAKKLSDNLQGMVGMMQMMAAQNPKADSGFANSLRLAAAGKRFSLKASISKNDIEQGFKSAGPALAAGRAARPGRPAALEHSAPVAGPQPCPIELAFVRLLPGEGNDFRQGTVKVTNRASKAIRDVEATYNYVDASGRWLGRWKQRLSDVTSDILVGPNASREVQCQLFRLPSGTESVKFTIHEVVFADGERWTAKE